MVELIVSKNIKFENVIVFIKYDNIRYIIIIVSNTMNNILKLQRNNQNCYSSLKYITCGCKNYVNVYF